MIEKSPPAALPDAGLIALISFLTIAFLISPCEILNSILVPFSQYWPFEHTHSVFLHNCSWSLKWQIKSKRKNFLCHCSFFFLPVVIFPKLWPLTSNQDGLFWLSKLRTARSYFLFFPMAHLAFFSNECLINIDAHLFWEACSVHNVQAVEIFIIKRLNF